MTFRTRALIDLAPFAISREHAPFAALRRRGIHVEKYCSAVRRHRKQLVEIFKTNVWRMFQALDLTDPDKQIAYYDDGVGTSSFKLFAVLGGVFGFGLKRNVIDIYSLLLPQL